MISAHITLQCDLGKPGQGKQKKKGQSCKLKVIFIIVKDELPLLIQRQIQLKKICPLERETFV